MIKRTLVLASSLSIFSFGASGLSPSASPIGSPPAAQPPKAGGSVIGSVRFLETPPKPERLIVDTNADVCGLRKFSQDFIVSTVTKGLKNVVLTVIGVPAPATVRPAGNAAIHQKQCEYEPHVQTAVVGQKLEIRNHDDVLHNIHSYDEKKGTLFNLAQPIQNQVNSVTLDREGVVTVKCDVHRWMLAYIVVGRNPYTAVTGQDGAYRIDGIPPGSYKIRAWHETLGQLTKDVTVVAGRPATVNFDVGM